MKPVNNKSLLHFIFDQMEKLDKKEISVDDAKAQANFAKQANNTLRYELDRADIQMRLSAHNKHTGDNIEFREVEGKAFDDTTK